MSQCLFVDHEFILFHYLCIMSKLIIILRIQSVCIYVCILYNMCCTLFLYIVAVSLQEAGGQ
jgi:hypothetical protein